MKKIFVSMIFVLSLFSCKILVTYAYHIDYIYVNNSGVEVAIVGKNKGDKYSDVPDSLVLANGESYVITGIPEGPGPYDREPGENNKKVKVYFNKETLIIHDNRRYDSNILMNIRDIRDMYFYSSVKTGDHSSDATYTFTPEDYELALKLQKE